MNSVTSNIFRCVAPAAVLIVLSASASAQTQRVGASYSPTGSDYTVTALQGIDSSNPNGQSAIVNLDFEMKPSIGVTYDQGGGKLKDFGIGLYSSGHNGPVESTGLAVTYDTLVTASSATLTVEDFDIHSLTSGFKPGKVEPLISVYGAGGALIGTATPQQVLASMTANGKPGDDVWDINMATLLSNMHSSATSISKVVLFADAANGEKTSSDPFLLRAISKGQPVPEPASLCALALGAGLLIRRRRAKNA